MVENGKNKLPACVVRSEGLAVRYFELSANGLFAANDAEYELLETDVLKQLPDPTPVPCGSRIYYEFIEL